MAKELQWKWFVITLVCLKVVTISSTSEFVIDCDHVLMGQYLCKEPDIDPKTQQPRGCTKDGLAKINCTLVEGLLCNHTYLNTFEKEIDCHYTNGRTFETAMLLAVFLGTFGVDRFYLGYPAIGLLQFILREIARLLKLCTLGFMFLGQFVDIILIATQTLGPADGSNYIINYYGQGIEILKMNNETYKHGLESSRVNFY